MIENRVCAVAYTINEFQPVICTHIGDQPLYYIDEEEIIEDEELLDASELGLLADEIRTLKEEILGLGQELRYVEEKTITVFKDFFENMNDLNSENNFYLSADEQSKRLVEIKEILSTSRLACAYINAAEKYDVELVMSEQVETAYYDRRSGKILLHPHNDLQEHILLAVRELRRHWQHRIGALINPLTFIPEHAILVSRAQEADLAVSVIRVAWELQLAGSRNVWERVENSPMSDLARAYEREVSMDFRTINNGFASAAVFEAWFLSERCRQKDKKVVQSMLADHKGYVFESDQSSHTVTVELISALGEMPFGKNYLGIHAKTIMDDPIFMEVRDRSNANFLWFIKFERSFKETEQHLQSESDLSTHDVRHELYPTQGQGQKDGIPQKADIIQLSEYAGFMQSNQPQKDGASADVIDFKVWSLKQ